MNIGIIDYGLGNLFSVAEALKRLGCTPVISDDIAVLQQTDALILPGVGAFPDAMKQLSNKNFVTFLQVQKKPLLGICLGMQLLFESSNEGQLTEGLGLLQGIIQKFDVTQSRIPHMGWNQLQWHKSYVESETDYVYFVHSFYASHINEQDLMASADYANIQVPAIVQHKHITGMQFHPEKSGDLGTALLKQWLKEVAK
ncbi:imidazole glycerol phosphate synthase subunit HisH [Lysinibacillus alkalisoli]|uniref:Imidazole glycerol phosphate synthase subunit HisH n=1 Tax=Lysinibacillus alkalisoli TaxID=1911548 RepID=A0A917G622_9BACI|nr:imidazole glycerol phosphate synthase subunit HisH [Lysinibacillus alkalisoli]GGG23573.1 imidazole glycerol phosphate synthase subunit HisH [Lysinibacillus alkalisoli]